MPYLKLCSIYCSVPTAKFELLRLLSSSPSSVWTFWSYLTHLNSQAITGVDVGTELLAQNRFIMHTTNTAEIAPPGLICQAWKTLLFFFSWKAKALAGCLDGVCGGKRHFGENIWIGTSARHMTRCKQDVPNSTSQVGQAGSIGLVKFQSSACRADTKIPCSPG